ncbi:MAG: hypothetical protein AAF800_06065 [Planctomycetota bacterium]
MASLVSLPGVPGFPGVALADTAAGVAEVEGLLRRAESNLESVQQSLAGRDAPPRGSAGKLLVRRLDQARDDLNPAGEIVATLPADGPGVAEVATRHQAAVTLHTRLAAFMNGGQAPAADAGPADGEVPLGYPHADQFKNATFTLRNKVEAPANQLVQLQAELQPVDDQLSINHRTTAQAVATIAEARRQAGFVDDALAPVPANGQGVAAAKQRLAAARQAIDGSETYFAPLNAKLAAIVDPANYPNLFADQRKLSDIRSTYGQEWMFRSGRDLVAELHAQRPVIAAELNRMGPTYGRLIQQQTQLGKELGGVAQSAVAAVRGFDQQVEAQRQTLPGEITAHLAEAKRLAAEAVAQQKPAFFAGGIPQQTDEAEDRLKLLEAIAPDAGTKSRAEYAAAAAELDRMAAGLREQIIAENRPPTDRFAGDDRDQAIATAVDAWGYQEQGFEVLGVRIPAEAWERQERFFFDGELDLADGTSTGTLTKQDRSRLQVQLLIAVKDNPRLAKIVPVNVWKDHMKGDTMIGTPLFAGDEELAARSLLLRENIE